MTLKSWGDDDRLIQSVVVLSSSKAALGIQIPLNILRAEAHSIGDLTDSESKTFINQLFKDCDPTIECDEKFNKAVDKAHSLIGNRLLHLHEVRKSLKKVNNLKEAMEQIVKVEARNRRSYSFGTIRFINTMVKNHYSKQEYDERKVFAIFQKLQRGERVESGELSEAFAIEEAVLIESLSTIEPHPFYIHPTTKVVTLGSHFMHSVLGTEKIESAVEKYPEITL